MNLRSTLAAFALVSALPLVAALAFGGGAVARAAEKCGPHQHVAEEKNEDEGGTVKRCVCDDGWNGGGPVAPCKRVKAKPKPKE